jgi:hypothetical protein
MLIMGLEGEDVRVPCGHMQLQPAFGGLMRLRACSCPSYVAPAPARLRWANWVLGWTQNPFAWGVVLAFFLAGSMLLAEAVL